MLRHNVLELHPDIFRHAIADAAGVVSHQSNGQPFPVATRMKAIPEDVANAIVEELNNRGQAE